MKLFWTPFHRGLKWPMCVFLLAAVILSGCSSPNPILFSDSPQPPASATGAETALPESAQNDLTAARFHVGDTITVDLSGTLQKIPDNVQTVTEDGTITLPYIGAVRAAGLTAGELQREIHDAYVPKYYTELTVNVNGPQLVYYVGGEVKLPNRYQYVGPTTVTKAIQAAGDFTDFANRKKVQLIRNNGERIKVDCVKAAQDPSLDPPVYPGDQILVPRRVF